jgi:threonine/homoserine/homoserine lactone efflux protein
VDWSSYVSFLAFAATLVLVPGADFTVIVRNTLTGGVRRGQWGAAGVASSNALQGSIAVAGLGAIIVHSQPLFQAIKWAGVGYLTFLALQALHSAWIGRYHPVLAHGEPAVRSGDTHQQRAGWRQGFFSNITNPKVLVFYLAVLPQFVGPSTPYLVLVVFGLSHAALSLTYLLFVVASLNRVRTILSRRTVRRTLDGTTGVILLGFGARLAVEG